MNSRTLIPVHSDSQFSYSLLMLQAVEILNERVGNAALAEENSHIVFIAEPGT